MEINYHLTEEDYINFNLFHIKNSKAAIRILNMQRFIMPIIFLIFSYIFARFGDISFPISFLIYFILGILWIIFYPKYFYNHTIRNIKRMFNEGKNDGLLGEHHLTLNEDGMAEITPNGEVKIKWSAIQKFQEDELYFFLYNSSMSAIIIPKREIANIEQLRVFISSRIK